MGGGSAANTACWLASLGSPVSLVAAVGDDELGRIALGALDGLGVRLRRPGRAEGWPPGSCVVLIDETGERTMLPDRGANERAVARGGRRRHRRRRSRGCTCPATRCSATARTRPPRRPWRAARRLGRARGRSTPPAPRRCGPRGPSRFLGWIDGCTVLFANDDELDALGGRRRRPGSAARGGREARAGRRVVDRRHALRVLAGRAARPSSTPSAPATPSTPASSPPASTGADPARVAPRRDASPPPGP